MGAEARLAELKLELPPAPKPVATYVTAVRHGDLLYVSGHGPLESDGTMITGRLGDIFPDGARDQGAYFEDTRFLSKLRLSIAGGPPVVLSTQSGAEYTSQVDLTVTSTQFGGLFNDPVNFLHLRREQIIDEHFIERLTLSNYLVRDIDYWIEYEFASDDGAPAKVLYQRKHKRPDTEEVEDVREEDRLYKPITIDGVVAPYVIDHFRDGIQASRTNYESVEFNKKIEDSLFAKPASFKAVK